MTPRTTPTSQEQDDRCTHASPGPGAYPHHSWRLLERFLTEQLDYATTWYCTQCRKVEVTR